LTKYCIILEGIPLAYGKRERWKEIAEKIGRTKPSRAPNAVSKRRKKNDGRPPDTSAELLAEPKKNKNSDAIPKSQDAVGATSKSNNAKIVSYRWKENSCWLDVSMELLYHATTLNFADFASRFEGAHSCSDASPLRILWKSFDERWIMESKTTCNEVAMMHKLEMHRDKLRQHLLKNKIIRSGSSFESDFVIFISYLI
jgi:hypothetical protein